MPMHPRPQLTRPAWHELGGAWQFAFDDGDVGRDGQWQAREDPFDRVIQVPFPFESPASGIGDRGFHPVVWYRRVVHAQVAADRRLLLHLGAVDHRAEVWVNGRSVVRHEGGSTPFSADVTAALDASGEQVVVVRAEDDPHDLRQPRGKQDWEREPHAVWYDRTTGIWQPVWTEEVPATRVESLHWVPDLASRSVQLTAAVAGPLHPGSRLRVVLRRGDRVLADDTCVLVGRELVRSFSLPTPDPHLLGGGLLWSPETPDLVDAEVTLLAEDGAVLDEVGSYTALRSVAAEDGRFLLNDRAYFLRMALAQNFWPESHLAAPDEDALRREVQLAKDLGFNGVRVHQKVEDPRFLAWCDRIGLLVWVEMPSAYEFSSRTVDRLTREWLEVVERDRSHPCVVAWVPFNESWGVPDVRHAPDQQHLVRALYHLAKALDSTRLVVGNDGWEHVVTDLLTVHDYTARGDRLRHRYAEALPATIAGLQPGHRALVVPGGSGADAPVVLSEFGGITLDLGADAGWGGYGAVHSPEELLAGYRDLVGALLAAPDLAGFCWTQLTDVQQERNGLLTAAREPKAPIDQLRAVTTALAAAIPASAIGQLAYGDDGADPGD